MNFNLDNALSYNKADLMDMNSRLESYPKLLSEGWQESKAIDLPPSYSRISKILIHGMGGSAISGDLLLNVLNREAPEIEVFVHRDYDLPGWVGDDTLVISSSHSGETEEVISGVEIGQKNMTKMLAITSGGTLQKHFLQYSLPVFLLPKAGPPRTLFPFVVGLLCGILDRLALANFSEQIERANLEIHELQQSLDRNTASVSNKAKSLAATMDGTVPIIYIPREFSSVGRRWKAQLNENAKIFSSYELLPEAHHNSIMALEKEADAYIILITPSVTNENMDRRYKATELFLESKKVSHATLEAPGSTILSQALGACLLADYTSYYLALIRGVQPSPNDSIDEIKRILKKNYKK
tara:strand:+ start:624 stop:1685 length:1062 start_codon:yes stop_codon:yes gene_type:complete